MPPHRQRDDAPDSQKEDDIRRLLAVIAGVTFAFTSHAVASASCTAGHHYYAGYHKNQIVADGKKLNAKITFNSGTYYGSPDPFIVAWDGVAGSNGQWLQAGINKDPVYGRVLYIEYQTATDYTFVPEGSIVAGNPYTALVQPRVTGMRWPAGTPLTTSQCPGWSGLSSTPSQKQAQQPAIR